MRHAYLVFAKGSGKIDKIVARIDTDINDTLYLIQLLQAGFPKLYPSCYMEYLGETTGEGVQVKTTTYGTKFT
jgi:hypothetical protein